MKTHNPLTLRKQQQYAKPLAEIASDLWHVLLEQADYYGPNQLHVWIRIGRHASAQDCQQLHQRLQQFDLARCDARQDLQLEQHEIRIYTPASMGFSWFGLFGRRKSSSDQVDPFAAPSIDLQPPAPVPQQSNRVEVAPPTPPQYQAGVHVLDVQLEQLIFAELSRLIQDLKALNAQLQHHPQHNIGLVHAVVFTNIDAHQAQVQRFLKILENPINRRVLIERLVTQIDGQMVGYVDARHVVFQLATPNHTAAQLPPALDMVGQQNQQPISVQLDYRIEMRTPPQPNVPVSNSPALAQDLPCPLTLVVKDQRHSAATPMTLNVGHQPFVIGRDPLADYTVMVDKSAPTSRRHVEFFVQDRAWWCRNIGSNPILVGENQVLKPTEQLLLVNKMSLCLGTSKADSLGKYHQYPVLEVLLQHATLSVDVTPMNHDEVPATSPQLEPAFFDQAPSTAPTTPTVQACCIIDNKSTPITQLPFYIGRLATGLTVDLKYHMVSNQHFEVVAVSSQGVTVKLCEAHENPSFFTDPTRKQLFEIKPHEEVLIEFHALLIVTPKDTQSIDADNACIVYFSPHEVN